MGAWIDRTGHIVGRLTVTGYLGSRKWSCHCECGNRSVVSSCNLATKAVLSCGCLRNERIPRTHGLSGTAEHKIWKGMHARCKCVTNKRYGDYGGRGISVCARWISFDTFLQDMGPRPSPRHSIERIDNDQGYSPENCIWATQRRQTINRRHPKKKKNALGVRGIYVHRDGRFLVKYSKKHIGLFEDFFEACCARKALEARDPDRNI